jgi:hypothetical protein
LAETTTAERGELTRETFTTVGAEEVAPTGATPKTKANQTLMRFIIWNFAHFPLY